MTKREAAEDLKNLMNYSERTGVKTMNAQATLLRQFTLFEQTEIIRLVSKMLNVPPALTGGVK